MFSKKFLLSVIPGKLLIEVQDIYVGDTETIVVTPPKGSTGDISIDINGTTYTVPISNDTAVFNIKGLSANTYTVEAIYGSLHATGVQFTVNKIPASMYNISTKSKDIRQGTDEIEGGPLQPDGDGADDYATGMAAERILRLRQRDRARRAVDEDG